MLSDFDRDVEDFVYLVRHMMTPPSTYTLRQILRNPYHEQRELGSVFEQPSTSIQLPNRRQPRSNSQFQPASATRLSSDEAIHRIFEKLKLIR